MTVWKFRKLVKLYSKEMNLYPIGLLVNPSFSNTPNCYALPKTIIIDSSYLKLFSLPDAKRLVCHELSHIKHKDKFINKKGIEYKMLNICKEIRADIEGNRYSKLTDKEINCVFDVYHKKYNLSKKEAFNLFYPDYLTRIYFVTNFDIFDEAVLCEILYQYRDFYNPAEEQSLFKFLEEHLFN